MLNAVKANCASAGIAGEHHHFVSKVCLVYLCIDCIVMRSL